MHLGEGRMSATFAIASRDFKSFFGTPLGWIAACIIFLVSGIVFYIIVNVLLMRGQSMDPAGDIFGQILSFLNYLNIFIIPAFTLRVLSEELHLGTYRLLSSSPISTWSIVCGKFLGILSYFGVLGLFLLIYPLFTIIFTTPDIKVMLSGWFGLILNSAAIIAIGLFVASTTKNPVISYLGSAFFILLFVFFAYIPGIPSWYKANINLLSLSQDFTRGVVNTGSIATYLGIVVVFLTLTYFILKCKKWRI